MGELLSLLRFNAGSGHIWLDEQRMLLLHARAFAELRKELLDSLGVERARGLLVRMGFASGQRDGELAVKERRAGLRTEDAFMLGPRLHSIEGIVSVEMIKLEMDLENKQFFGEFIWENSWECEAHVADFGYGDDPQCWSQIGYASGYTSAFMGRLVVFKEVECTSMGDSRCRIVGHVAEEWQDERYLDYFRQHHVAERLIEFNLGLEHLRALQPRREYDQKLVGVSPGFRAAFDLLRTAARSAITVLLLGESGTGKELLARALHDNSAARARARSSRSTAPRSPSRSSRPSCSATRRARSPAPPTRARRPLRGRERRHAVPRRDRRDLAADVQVKLLRVLQEGEIERLGADRRRAVDVRIVAATNVDLPRAMQGGHVPRGPLLPPQRLPGHAAAAARAPRRHPGCSSQHFVDSYAAKYGKKLQRPHRRRCASVMRATRGRATSASSRT